MGSILKTSTPRYAPAPYVPYTPPTSEPAAETPKTDNADAEKVQDAIRRVARNRGIGSTILTSFRGVLDDQSTLAPQRKNLLGE